MKLNNLIKYVVIILAILMILSCIVPNFIYATSWTDTTQFTSSDTGLNDSIRNIIGAILNVTRIIATGVAIIMLTVLAMKYMMSAPNDRADIKKHAVVYIVGAVILFAGTGILTIIKQFSESIQ